MKRLYPLLTIFIFLSSIHTATSQSECSDIKSHGAGFTTSIESVVFLGTNQNGDELHTITLRIENDGCTDPDCKSLNHYAVEADPGTYSNISYSTLSGNITYGGINMGPNLGGVPFMGFRISNINGIGNGQAGVFTITYTLTGGLQDQQTHIKASSFQSVEEFYVSEFENVLNCSSNIIPYYPPPIGGKLLNSLIGPELTSLYDTYIEYDSLVSNDVFQIVDDTNVIIELFALDGQFNTLLALLQTPEFGLTNVAVDPSQQRISGVFPVINLMSLNGLTTHLSYARPVYPGIPQVGLVTSQGDTSLYSHIARNGFNVDGEGIKIGVLSDSYNTQIGNLAADDVVRGDLPGPANPDYPTSVDVLMDYPFGVASDEGRAMMHIIHDIAPGAELAFRTGLISAADFANGIIELQEAGCDVIVDDITYISEPFLDDGIVAQAVDSVVGLGVSYFTAAGNFGSKSVQGTFNPATTIPSGLSGEAHNFADSGPEDIFQSITVAPGDYTIVLQWEDGSGFSESNTDMDIYLAYENGTRLFGFNRDNSGISSIEVLPFTVTETSNTNILIVRSSGIGPVDFKYIVFRGDIVINEYNSSISSTIVGHANSENAMTVGAVLYSNTPAYGVNPPTIASFSSTGGTLVSGLDRMKPDFTGPNGVNTNVDLGGFNLEGDPFPNFFGTSAAAPHIAGVAALLLNTKEKYYGADSSIAPEQMRAILQSTAIDMETPGFDNLSGAGLVNSFDALATLATPSPYVSAIIYDMQLIPGIDTIPISVIGENLTSGSEIYFNGAPLDSLSTVSGDTLISSFIPPFDEYYPEIQVYNPPGAMTNGLDGGLSNPLYFSVKPTIVIDINDTAKKYAEVMPQFTAEYTVLTPDTVMTLAGAGLSTEAIQRILNIPLITVANDTSNVGLWPITTSPDDPLSPTGTMNASNPLDTALLYNFNFNVVNGLMTIGKLDLMIIPMDTTIVFGDTIIGFDFYYVFNNDTITPENNIVINDSVNAAVLNGIRQSHATALVNAVGVVRATALVNELGEPLLDSTALANSSFFITNAVMQKHATALVNGSLLNALQIYNAKSSSATALVNGVATVRATALVNGLATVLVNGVATALVNTGTLVNAAGTGSSSATALVNTNTVNDSTNSSALVILDEDDVLILAGDSIGDVEILSLSVITGNNAGIHWSIPGAWVSNNFNISYGLGQINILQDTAELIIDSTSLEHIYDGTPKEVIASTMPGSLELEITYDGDSNPPINAGTYLVNITVRDTNYLGWTSASMTILPDTASISFDSLTLTQVYDGNIKAVSGTTTPDGLTLIYSFDVDPVNVGQYQVTAVIDDPNYLGSAMDTLTITPATAILFFDSLSLTQVYDGTLKSVSATTSPENLAIVYSFNSDPINAGKYEVIALVDELNYIGTAADTLTITPAVATIIFDPGSLLTTYTGLPQTVMVSTVPSGLTVDLTYDGTSTAPTNAGGFDVLATVSDPNYIGYAMDVFMIQPAAAVVEVDLAFIFAGDPLPTFTASFNGLVNGENGGVVDSLTFSLSPPYNGDAGLYSIIPYAEDDNYVFSFVNGSLYVNPYGPGTKHIKTQLQCVEELLVPDSNGYTYVAHFSYENNNSTDMYIPIGSDNKLTSSGSYNSSNQPVVFYSGGGSWSAGFDGKKLTWKVASYKHNGHKTSVASNASSSSNKCNKSEALEEDEDEDLLSSFKAYPNPVHDRLTIETGNAWTSGVDVYVFDVFGKMHDVRTISGGDDLIEINMTGLKAGIYIIKLQGEFSTEIIRIVKN